MTGGRQLGMIDNVVRLEIDYDSLQITMVYKGSEGMYSCYYRHKPLRYGCTCKYYLYNGLCKHILLACFMLFNWTRLRIKDLGNTRKIIIVKSAGKIDRWIFTKNKALMVSKWLR